MHWLTFDLSLWLVVPVVVVLIIVAYMFHKKGKKGAFLLLLVASLFMHFGLAWSLTDWIWIPFVILIGAFVMHVINAVKNKEDEQLSSKWLSRSLRLLGLALAMYFALLLWQWAMVSWPLWAWVIAIVVACVTAIVFVIKRAWWLLAAAIIAVIALIIGAVAFGAGHGGPNDTEPSTSPSETTEPSPSPSPSETTAELNAKAAAWVIAMASNFEDAGELPEACTAYEPSVDLTSIHYYAQDAQKETPEAFGTDIGDTPCEIAMNRVERGYRDPFWVSNKANEIKAVDPDFDFVPFEEDEQAQFVANLAKAPFSEREALADKVFGWYANPSRVLSISEVDGPYTSQGASTADNGVTVSHDSTADKKSTVITTKDRKTGKVIKEDRADCGDQPYFRPPPPEKPECKTNCVPVKKCPPNPPDSVYTWKLWPYPKCWDKTEISFEDQHNGTFPNYQAPQTDRGNQEQAQVQPSTVPKEEPSPNPVVTLPDTDEPEVIESAAPDPTPGGYDGGSTSQPGASGTPDPGPSQPAVDGDNGGF